MKKGSTVFLKGVVFLIGLIALVICILKLPEMAQNDALKHPETAYLQYPFLISAYIMALPFFFALYQAFQLLTYIDTNNAFSELSINALKTIKYCAITISLLMVSGIVIAIIMFHGEDMAGIIMMGIIVTFTSGIVATFAAVLQKLLRNAIDIKLENDLTV